MCSWAHVAYVQTICIDLSLWYIIQYCRCWHARIFRCPASGRQHCSMIFLLTKICLGSLGYFSMFPNLRWPPDPLTRSPVHVWATLLARASQRGTRRLYEGRGGPESRAIQRTLQVLLDLLSHWSIHQLGNLLGIRYVLFLYVFMHVLMPPEANPGSCPTFSGLSSTLRV